MASSSRGKLIAFLDRNWFGVLAVLGSLYWNIWASSEWVTNRQYSERDLQAQVTALKVEIDRTRDIYVRQDVFNATMISIERRLTSIDGKLGQ